MDLFCTSGTSPTTNIENLILLASGSAQESHSSLILTNIPYISLENKLLSWKNNLEIERTTTELKLLFNKKILSLKDLMIITGFARQTIYNMVSQKRIPYSKRGRKLFFSSVEILNWIQEGESV